VGGEAEGDGAFVRGGLVVVGCCGGGGGDDDDDDDDDFGIGDSWFGHAWFIILDFARGIASLSLFSLL
jgi:hypothetical protein